MCGCSSVHVCSCVWLSMLLSASTQHQPICVQITCTLDISAGGDLAMIGGQNCISSCNGPCPCPWCACPKNRLSEIGAVFTQRTRRRIQLLAHVITGQCPGCDMTIVREVSNAKTQVKLCCRGCPHPAVPSKKKGKGITHLGLHEGVTPGQTVNFHLEPCAWCMCLLHCGLCMQSGLLQKTLLNHIDELVDPAVSEGHGKQLHDLFTKLGCYFKVAKLKKKSKNMTKHDLSFKGLSFTGRSGEIVHRCREQVGVCVCPRVYLCLPPPPLAATSITHLCPHYTLRQSESSCRTRNVVRGSRGTCFLESRRPVKRPKQMQRN